MNKPQRNSIQLGFIVLHYFGGRGQSGHIEVDRMSD